MSVKLTSFEIAFLTYEQRVEYFLGRAKEVHGDRYLYENMNYVKNKEKINITCKNHGVFIQTPHDHLKGRGCPYCGGKKQSNTEEFIEKAKKIHGDRYSYVETQYTRAIDRVKIVCSTHGVFTQRAESHLSGRGCRLCTDRQSRPELEIISLIMDLLPNEQISTSVSPEWMQGHREIDIYVPSKRFAIEYNGDYWHSEKFGRDKEWHQRKHDEARAAGITLLHIWDSRWNCEYKLVYLNIINNLISGNHDKIAHLIIDNIWLNHS